MTNEEACDLLTVYMNNAVDQYGYPILERLEVVLLIIGRRDQKLIQQWASDMGLNKRMTCQTIADMAEVIQTMWIQILILTQQADTEGTPPPQGE